MKLQTTKTNETSPLSTGGAESNISFAMFNVIGGVKIHNFQFEAISDNHAIVVAQAFYDRVGLIGRYYCETSTGKTFSVS